MPGTLDPPLAADDHVSGPRDARHELVMYGDFQCPYCAAAQRIIARVRTRLGDDLRFVFRHLPLDEVHPLARKAAEAAEAAAAQGAFWPMHDALFAARGRLAEPELVEHARGLGLDAGRVAAELAEGTHAARVQRDADSARQAGLTGTPAFYANGRLLSDTYDASSLVAALEVSS
jgi:protein-disulfide isomerase